MPPKVKISREDIIKTCLEIVKVSGTEGINARNIGRDVAGRRVEPIENYAEYFWYDSSREYVALNNYPS